MKPLYSLILFWPVEVQSYRLRGVRRPKSMFIFYLRLPVLVSG
jgi:hypothetical protein